MCGGANPIEIGAVPILLPQCNRMKKIFFLFTCCLLLIPPSSASRMPPKEVKSVIYKNIELRAPHEKMGYVEAWDVTAKTMLWEKKIYSVYIDTWLEEDVQWVFITDLQIKGNELIVTNELNKQYVFNVDTKQVRWLVPEGMEIFSTNLTIQQAVQMANAYCDEKNFNTDEYVIDRAEYDWDAKTWIVFYQGKAPAPGNHFTVYLDDVTGEVELFLGR